MVRIKVSAYFAIGHGFQFILLNMCLEMVPLLALIKVKKKKGKSHLCPMRGHVLRFSEDQNILSLEPDPFKLK